jgi:hypothetical protein
LTVPEKDLAMERGRMILAVAITSSRVMLPLCSELEEDDVVVVPLGAIVV